MDDRPLIVETIGERSVSHPVNRLPDACPICLQGIEPTPVRAISHFAGLRILQVVFRCPRNECQNLFIATYETSPDIRRRDNGFFLRRLEPRRYRNAEFSDHITRTSKLFVEIFNEASAAETAGLQHIAGMGFRKALEFLVKDFCKVRNPEDDEAIEAAMLGPCIERFVDDPKVKECAKRAAWLGNDETHYLRRWNDKTVEDLKMLIRLTVMWVEAILLTEQFIESMPDKPKKR